MGLLDGKTHSQYYGGEGDAFGSYQFTSLNDIISYFMIVYVGENKIIPKAKVSEIAFHAQRALAELSFDTLKSVKSQEIILPPSLTIVLPHDYVDYTKLSWSDSSGIKHPLYKTNSTSNPFSIEQEENGDYFFENQYVSIVNGDFELPLSTGWNFSEAKPSGAWDGLQNAGGNYPSPLRILDTIGIVSSELEFAGLWRGTFNGNTGGAYGAWQRIDVSNARTMNLSANGQSAAEILDTNGVVLCGFGIVRIGLTTTNPSIGWFSQGTSGLLVSANLSNPSHPANPSPNQYAEYLDLGYLEWNDGSVQTKELDDIDVTNVDEVWVYVQSQAPWNAVAVENAVWTNDPATPKQWSPNASTNNTHSKNKVDSVTVTVNENNPALAPKNSDGNSDTFSNYKSVNPSENNSDDYQDDTYWPLNGNRYGLDPQHAQVNGSFYIDNRLGKINFSSNIAGKTVILDYISDSLGSDAEMQVHKFAEDAMYKCIAHSMLSTTTYGQQLIPRLTKEKFAAVRKAKLRLSGLNIEELTQILRGKSKQIKH
tara:strand:+ start:292 stop:1905 length:1614 start_codon:yes stop_codon:yes gene_type:complete